MKKSSFVFPGQGSQYVGMGQEVAEAFPAAARVFEEAEDHLHLNLRQICWFGPEPELTQNDVVQPAILTVSLAILAVLEQRGILPDLAAGLSVGEYSALVAAHSLDLGTAVRLVRKRGQIMKAALPPGSGGMLAVLGLSRSDTYEICDQAKAWGVAEPANFNCPGQVVIGGTEEALKAIEPLALQKGARKVARVAMSSPSHCSLLLAAAEELRLELDGVQITDAVIPIVANADAKIWKKAADIREKLSLQLSKPVLWEDSVQAMADYGVTTFVEVGPGRILSGFIRRTVRGRTIMNVENVAGIDECTRFWEKEVRDLA